jgi:hypothetical protein
MTMRLDDEGGPIQSATLVNLNPTVNAWYLLRLEWPDGRTANYHLVNAHPDRQDLALDPAYPNGIVIADTRDRRLCDLWSDDLGGLHVAETARTPYLPLCDERVTLRLTVPGRRTTLEWATDFLRDNVWSGEQITIFIRENFYQDAYLETADMVDGATPASEAKLSAEGPQAARIDSRFLDARIGVGELGLVLSGGTPAGVIPGRWYPADYHHGVYVSVVTPDMLDPELFQRHRDVVSVLDEEERDALVYLVAFDLGRFDIGFALGTEHPRVGWSERAPDFMRDPSLLGPDGIGDVAPLVMTGIVPRSIAVRTVATFTGGFKRDHGAFRIGALSTRNHASHYGFIESGTILSKLQPGLATFFVLDDGMVQMKTWSEADGSLLPRIVFARQNGLPVIETDPDTKSPVPGRQVSQWAAGNWSGSQDRKFRTVRGGAALQEIEGRRFLIYAYFSSATPSAMARVFEAYEFAYGMLLDMNALEHTYMALYRPTDGSLEVQHLVKGMEVLDKTLEGQALPRFLGFADNRDFFYVLRRGDHDRPSE